MGDRATDRAAESPDEPRSKRRSLRILFACTHNAVRSPLAEAIARRVLGATADCRSVGVFAVTPLDARARAVGQELGLDLSRHRPTSFADLEAWGDDVCDFDVIVALSPAAQRHALEHARFGDVEVRYWATPDPTAIDDPEASGEAYRRLCDTLYAQIRREFLTPQSFEP